MPTNISNYGFKRDIVNVTQKSHEISEFYFAFLKKSLAILSKCTLERNLISAMFVIDHLNVCIKERNPPV